MVIKKLKSDWQLTFSEPPYADHSSIFCEQETLTKCCSKLRAAWSLVMRAYKDILMGEVAGAGSQPISKTLGYAIWSLSKLDGWIGCNVWLNISASKKEIAHTIFDALDKYACPNTLALLDVDGRFYLVGRGKLDVT